MSRVLILYPKEFMSYSKFERKVSNILSQMNSACLIYKDDPNGFIAKYLADNDSNYSSEKIDKVVVDDLTHGIVFDDGEVFPEETKLFKENDIPLRIINIAITRVVNVRKDTEYEGLKSTPLYEYIGRGSYWGNPYAIGEDGDDREEVIRKFKYDFDFDKFPNKKKAEAYKLAGKRLGCFCKPNACHGDVLADYLNSHDDGK